MTYLGLKISVFPYFACPCTDKSSFEVISVSVCWKACGQGVRCHVVSRNTMTMQQHPTEFGNFDGWKILFAAANSLM